MTDTSNAQQEIVVTGTRKPAAPPAPTYAVNVPRCFVDIYPFEGGMYSLPRTAVLTCDINKPWNGEVGGSFSLSIAPGGPNGVNIPPSWTEVITPMSTVVIGMSRGTHAAVTMVGVVLQVSEQNDWSSGQAVTGSVVITGMDFGYYFSLISVYSAWFLGATGIASDSSSDIVSLAGAATNDPILAKGLTSGTPDQMAQAWYTLPMAGDKGVFSKTNIAFQQSRVTFTNALATWFEHFNAETPNLFAAYLMGDNQSWADKFKMLLPFPWYEFNVITAPPDFYPAASGGFKFSSSGLGPSITATPTIVGRINPTPTLTATASNTNPTFTGLDCTRWNALQLFDLEGYNPPDCVVGFDESAVVNFFSINPTYMSPQMGQSNSQLSPYIFSFASAGDKASIERYGFRPANGSTSWLADPTGQIAQQGTSNNAQLLADLLARYCSTYAPLGLMARGTVSCFLRPDIMPGARFRFQPFKNGESWDFYIDSVSHKYVFGQGATTILNLSRGLPSTVYADNGNSGMLFNVHVGNAQRLNGKYQQGLPPGSDTFLQPIPPGSSQQFFQGLEQVYKTPQAAKAPS